MLLKPRSVIVVVVVVVVPIFIGMYVFTYILTEVYILYIISLIINTYMHVGESINNGPGKCKFVNFDF